VGEPFEFVPDHELKPGPGLLSGEDGEFVLFRLPREGDAMTLALPGPARPPAGYAPAPAD
jgi:hypothetical protein